MNEQTVFIAALELEPADRARFLDQECENNPGLRKRVERLIASHEAAVSFMDEPAGQLANTIDQPPLESSGAQIGPYKLLQEIGQGGMGVVYMAEQVAPVRRKVALKIIKPGMDTRQVIARFEAERQALSLMDHPHIAKVLDAGTTGTGRPYFVMELVKGQPITEYCDQQHLTPRQRLELFLPVCQAIQHAHQKGIIHRDVKPSNVLMAEYDGRPVAKVIDFGVAKAVSQPLTEKTMFTGLGQVVGTLEYMSPEQARVNQLDVDTRSDVYSLGVLLYELLTGSTPIEKRRLRSAAWDEMLRMIREEEPPRPSTRLSDSKDSLPSISAQRHTEPAKLTKLVRGELDWIVMKALEKDRNRRYETANGFAADIQRYLNDEAVAACPPSAAYRLRKFARRNKVGLGVVGLLLLFLLLLGSGTAWVIKDRLARRALTGQEVETALQEATRLAGERKWPEAKVWAQRAEDAVADGASVELQRRVRDIQDDLKAILRIEEIRLSKSNPGDYTFDEVSSDSAYAAAFRDLGVDADALDPAEAGHLLQARLISSDLAAALDDWAFVRQTFGRTGWEHLMEVARRVDPDPWRNRVRDAWQRRDGKALQALAESDEVAQMPPAAQIRLAQSLRTLVNAERAEAVLRRGQRQHPNDLWMNWALADIHHHVTPSRQDEIIRFVTAAVALRPNSPGIHFSLAYELAKSGRIEEAIAEYREVIRLKPDDPIARQEWGFLLAREGKLDEANALFDEAIGFLEEAIRRRPDDARGHWFVAWILLYGKKDYEGAIAHFKKAIQLDPKNAAYQVQVGQALSLQGKVDEAIAAYQEAIRLQPNNISSHISLGRILRDHKHDYESAITCFRKAIELDPKAALGYVDLGNALFNQNERDEAIACYRKAIELDQKSALGYFCLGNALFNQNRLDEAITAYRKAIEVDAKYGAYLELGNVLTRQRQFDKAVAAYRKGIEVDPKNAGLFFALGNTLTRQNKLDEAIAAYRKAIEVDPVHAVAQVELGNALSRQGKVDEAIAASQEAIRLRPNNSYFHLSLGRILRDHKHDYETAISCFHRAFELAPINYQAHNDVAVALQKLGKTDEAAAAFREYERLALARLREAYRQKPDDAGARDALALELNNLAWNLATHAVPGRRDPERALTLATEAVELKPLDGMFCNTLGTALYRVGHWKDAIETLEKAEVLTKGKWLGHNAYFIAMAHWQLDEKDKAREWYDRAVMWMDANQPKDVELSRFREEATELLGLKEKK